MNDANQFETLIDELNQGIADLVACFERDKAGYAPALQLIADSLKTITPASAPNIVVKPAEVRAEFAMPDNDWLFENIEYDNSGRIIRMKAKRVAR